LSTAMYGQVVGTISEQDRLTNIRIRYPDDVRFDRDQLGQTPIFLPPTGSNANYTATSTTWSAATPQAFVPLNQLASIELVRSPNEFWRENQQPVITVTAEPGNQDLGAINRELEQRLAKIDFPSGYRWELAGSYKAQQDSFGSLLMVLIVATAL